jgi:Zn-dependent M28 family amino/carboxypeptidase
MNYCTVIFIHTVSMKTFSLLLWLSLFLTGCVSSQQQLLHDVKELSSDKYKGRKSGTPENKLAAEYIIGRFKKIGLKSHADDYKMPFQFTDRSGNRVQGFNLIGYIQGKREEAIVVSAHYDHVGVIKDEIYNGADDNASGVGGLLAIAEYFSKHQPEHTLVFAAFDAEESGLQGAKAYVDHPAPSLKLIKLNVNMDMISRSAKNELFAVGTYHYPALKSRIVTKNKEIKLRFGHDDPKLGSDDWTNQSDHGAFHDKKIPFLYFGVEDHRDYHKPTDDYSRINKEFYKNAVSSILEVVQNLDRDITMQKLFKEKLIMD